MLAMSWAEMLGVCLVARKAALLVAKKADHLVGHLAYQTAAHLAVSSGVRAVDLRAEWRAEPLVGYLAECWVAPKAARLVYSMAARRAGY